MAAWFRDMRSISKAAVIAGCSVALSGAAYLIYMRLKHQREDNRDEGFEEVSKIEDEGSERKVLVLGLDGAGKSSLLASLGKQDQSVIAKPTEGFNVMCVQTEKVSLNIWEIGGAVGMRQYWNNFLQDTGILVYVVDSAAPDRFPEACNALKALLTEDLLKGVAVVIVASKQDRPNARTIQEVRAAMDVDHVTMLNVMATEAPPKGTRKGIHELEQLLTSLSS